MRSLTPLFGSLLVLVACSRGEDPADPAVQAAKHGESAQEAGARARGADVRAAAALLESGALDEARARIDALADPASKGGNGEVGVDGPLLRARLALAQGNAVLALKEVEAARRGWPSDPAVFATAAEIYAAVGQISAAEEEIRTGLLAGGEDSAELERARGSLLIGREGGQEAGLLHLERARALAPELPFVDAPLALAHVLVGRLDMGREAPAAALRHAEEALRIAPSDALMLDALELSAEGSAAVGDFERALELYAQLGEAGRAPGDGNLAELHQRAATAQLLLQDRPGAIEHYLAARDLGLGSESLGFGASVLREEAAVRIERGIRHYEDGRVEEAAQDFRAALSFEPENVEAQNHLGVALFRLERFDEAASAWRDVLDYALRTGWDPPEPVHLNLARALRMGGRPEQASRVVKDYLEREPDGDWVGLSRELLDRLEAETADEAGD